MGRTLHVALAVVEDEAVSSAFALVVLDEAQALNATVDVKLAVQLVLCHVLGYAAHKERPVRVADRLGVIARVVCLS